MRNCSAISIYRQIKITVAPLSPEEIKNQFKARGEPISKWAAKRGFPLNRVYRVLNGQDKAYWGKGHEIAVALGMKSDPNQPSA